MQRVYNHITKVKNVCDHMLFKQAWNIECNVQKTNKRKILTSCSVLDILKWFKTWGVKDLLEPPCDAMKYVNCSHRGQITRGTNDEVARQNIILL